LSSACCRVSSGVCLLKYTNLITILEFLSLKNILYRDGVEIPEEIIEYVARNIKSNVRELEGAIISLIAQSSFKKRKLR
jgi:chromosomal replication initiation ATPase DnaA